MAISLQKGGNVNLSKEAPGMKKMTLGLGWDTRATDGAEFDLDASAFMLNADDGFVGRLQQGRRVVQPGTRRR